MDGYPWKNRRSDGTLLFPILFPPSLFSSSPWNVLRNTYIPLMRLLINNPGLPLPCLTLPIQTNTHACKHQTPNNACLSSDCRVAVVRPEIKKEKEGKRLFHRPGLPFARVSNALLDCAAPTLTISSAPADLAFSPRKEQEWRIRHLHNNRVVIADFLDFEIDFNFTCIARH